MIYWYLLLISLKLPIEIKNHLSIIFTHYPENPSKNDLHLLDVKMNQIKDYLWKIIVLSDYDLLYIGNFAIEADDDGNFIEKFQNSIEHLIMEMKENIGILNLNFFKNPIK